MDRTKKTAIIAAVIAIALLILAECDAENRHRDAETSGAPTEMETTAAPEDVGTTAEPEDIGTTAEPEDIGTTAVPEDGTAAAPAA